MVSGYYGNYLVRMDDKGRIALPAKLRPPRKDRNTPPQEFIITLGFDGCVTLYPDEEWQRILNKLETLDFTSKDYRNFSRQLFAGAVSVTPDRQGRMLIPGHLRRQGNLDGEVLVLGSGTYIEFWNPDDYKDYLNRFGQTYEEVAENLFPKNRPPKND